jgi:hypothetical protein
MGIIRAPSSVAGCVKQRAEPPRPELTLHARKRTLFPRLKFRPLNEQPLMRMPRPGRSAYAQKAMPKIGKCLFVVNWKAELGTSSMLASQAALTYHKCESWWVAGNEY